MLLSVGEINENKNHQIVMRAISVLHMDNLRYYLCGQGSKRNALERLAAELGIQDKICFLGYRSDVAAILRAADIFCFPSKREGLGLAALEAMATGIPIITSNVHGINDYSKDGITGCKCSPDDVYGFAGAIRKLIRHEVERYRMGQHNRDISKDFDVRRSERRMMDIYSYF